MRHYYNKKTLMNLRALVSVTGKPGLFKLIGQNKGGFILESLDDKKNKKRCQPIDNENGNFRRHHHLW